jgi:hypothetical protein
VTLILQKAHDLRDGKQNNLIEKESEIDKILSPIERFADGFSSFWNKKVKTATPLMDNNK